MKFEYSPATPDDWPSAIAVTATGVEEDSGIEEGETRLYEPKWKHRVAANTIREQREKMKALDAANAEFEDRLQELFECLAQHCTANLPPSDYTVDLWRSKLAKLGIEVPDEMER